MRQRRRQLGLSISRAAKEAGIDRGTWTSVEEATRETAEYNYGPIERTLRWKLGSIDVILAGGDPVPEDAPDTTRSGSDDYTDPVTGETYTDPDERALWDRRHLPENVRRELINFLRYQRHRMQASA